MAKIVVTKELAETLKTLRAQNNIKASELALHLGKSAAYVSKLEKGDIQTLKTETFDNILDFILKGEKNKDAIVETLYASLKVKYTDEEIEQQIWMNNYDTVFRIIPVPKELIDEINNLIDENNINRKDLLTLINQNQFLPDEDLENDNIPYNEWYESDNNGTCIKIHFEEDIFYDLLEKKILALPYIYPYTIIYYIFVVLSGKTVDEMTNTDCNGFQDKATSILNKHKFYSILERNRLLSERKTEAEKEELLSSFDRTNAKIINEILTNLKFMADTNIVLTNERLQLFLDNLKSDPWFMLKIVSLGFKELDGINTDSKKAFIDRLEELIKEYSTKSNSVETY